MSVDRLHFRDGSAAGEPDSGAAPRLSGRPGAWANAAWAWAWVFAGFVFSWGVVESRGATAGVASPDYLGEIRPLFRERCFACHGALKQKGGLRLDTVERMRRGGDSGPAFVARDASASALVQRIEARDAGERMPPEHEGELFSPEQISRVRAWIDAGGVGPVDDVGEPDPREHWAFRPRTRPEVPAVARPGWVRNPIDAFVARKHEEKGLEPQSEAPRDVLVRRLYVDLVGVTPTVEELGRLDGDQDAGWYERLVDRLLDDPRHGERWARHWMDIWRYSDAWGLGDQLRNSQRHIWRWRDWLVESANEDLPYDVMLRRMLAADETHPDDPGALRATGYLARNYFLFNRNHWLDEVVEHVGKGMLGLTVNCAKCHDHKYDPIPQADYYRLRAFFEPYQVRVDMIPGEPDLNRDGLPRAFDGPEVPTYRFVRGQETQPDKSVAISPGIPDLLAFRPLDIRAVRLPETAWQPERRSWVFEAYRADARRRVETAGSVETEAWQAYARALGRLAAPQPRGTGGASGESTPAQAPNLLEAEAVWAVAEQDRVLAQAHSSWSESRAVTRGPGRCTGFR